VEHQEETWKGVMYVSLMISTSILQTIFLGQYFHHNFGIAMRVKSTIMNAIYRKALVVSAAARKESTVGEIVNLMSVDAQTIMELIPFLNMLWSTPFQVGLAFYFLWQTMGVAVLVGLGLLLLLIPINSWLSSRVKKLQIGQMKNKDHRVKLMNEILNGIRVSFIVLILINST
jgi:ATP-binding cassette, subfamily C (CFTR/MRP), member 1